MKSSYEDKSWSFLISALHVTEDSFEESVVLLLEDNPESSYGIIINKPLGKTLADLDSNFANTPLGDVAVYYGGPVNRDKFSLVVWNDEDENHSDFSFGIKTDKALELLEEFPNAKIAAFMGFAGWQENQLDSELKTGGWYLEEVNTKYIGNKNCKNIWKKLVMKKFPIFKKFPKAPKEIDN